MNKKLNILVLSSISPYKSANLGLDVIKSFEDAGHNVDFITKYKFENMNSNMYTVLDTYEPAPSTTIGIKLKNKFKFLKKFHRVSTYFNTKKTNKFVIVNLEEDKPPVDPLLITSKITKQYDLVVTLFWQYMITAETLNKVYDKLNCPIFIYAVDMFPMTGGCYYFWDCRRFIKACGTCPGLNSTDEKDQSYKNFLIKKNIYNKIQYSFLGNTWMCNWALKSPLFQKECIKKMLIIVNENTFKNRSLNESRLLLGLEKNMFIMFAGAADINIKRKGFDILVASVNKFIESIPANKKENILLLLAGNNPKNIQDYFQVKVCNLGYLNIENLALAYSSADLYISSSIEDAGPSMVNQAMMCGTPVVAFNIGVALDLVITNTTGYLAKLFDIEDFSNGIKAIYDLPSDKRNKMRANCRKIILDECSLASFSNTIEKIYTDLNLTNKQ